MNFKYIWDDFQIDVSGFSAKFRMNVRQIYGDFRFNFGSLLDQFGMIPRPIWDQSGINTLEVLVTPPARSGRRCLE